ncbi:hypothetical protein J1614_008631 [Plenodomus biglobosus]|nr:hypothetical protein J1614_008631 [Plenodomus biglobosus]
MSSRTKPKSKLRPKPKTTRILITTTLFIFVLLIYALSPTTPYTSALQNLLLLRTYMRLPSTSTSTINDHAHASSKRATPAAALRTVIVVPVGGMQCVVM